MSETQNLQAPEVDQSGISTEEMSEETSQMTTDGSAPEVESESTKNGTEESASSPNIPKGWVWDGNPETLEDGFKERGRGMLRHFTKETEKLAQQRREMDQQRRELEDQRKALEAQAQQLKTPSPSFAFGTEIDPNEAYLSREFQDAIENGDTKKLYEVQNKLTDYRVQKQLMSVEPEYRKMIEQSQAATSEIKNSMLLKEFGEKNPRLWTHKDSGLASIVAREICDRQGKSLDEAYQMMEKIASFYQSEAKRSLNQNVQKMKSAVSETPTPPVDMKYVYVSSAKEADAMNIRFSMEGSDKIAVVKK